MSTSASPTRARCQLLTQRVLPGFEPTPEAFAPSVEVQEVRRMELAAIGVHDLASYDLLTAIVSGLVSQQLANDPGGDRWVRLLDEAMDLWLDRCGSPETAPGRVPQDRRTS